MQRVGNKEVEFELSEVYLKKKIEFAGRSLVLICVDLDAIPCYHLCLVSSAAEVIIPLLHVLCMQD